MNSRSIFRLKRAVVVAATLCCLALAGCQTVRPWERGTLATYGMRPDRDPIANHLAEHVHFTREATSGGAGVGGGGCGCN